MRAESRGDKAGHVFNARSVRSNFAGAGGAITRPLKIASIFRGGVMGDGVTYS